MQRPELTALICLSLCLPACGEAAEKLASKASIPAQKTLEEARPLGSLVCEPDAFEPRKAAVPFDGQGGSYVFALTPDRDDMEEISVSIWANQTECVDGIEKNRYYGDFRLPILAQKTADPGFYYLIVRQDDQLFHVGEYRAASAKQPSQLKICADNDLDSCRFSFEADTMDHVRFRITRGKDTLLDAGRHLANARYINILARPAYEAE